MARLEYHRANCVSSTRPGQLAFASDDLLSRTAPLSVIFPCPARRNPRGNDGVAARLATELHPLAPADAPGAAIVGAGAALEPLERAGLATMNSLETALVKCGVSPQFAKLVFHASKDGAVLALVRTHTASERDKFDVAMADASERLELHETDARLADRAD